MGYNHNKLKYLILLLQNDSVLTKMDVHVQTDKSQKPETFFIAIQSWPLTDRMSFITYERLTPYGKFASCAEKDVSLNLCICSPQRDSTGKRDHQFGSDVIIPGREDNSNHQKGPLDSDISIESKENNCVHIITLKNNRGVTFRAVHTCAKMSYAIRLVFLRKNMIVSDVREETVYIIRPGETISMLTAVHNNAKLKFKWHHLVETQPIK